MRKEYEKAYEFGLTKKTTSLDRAQIKRSKDAADYMRKFYFGDIGIYESFFILLLDQTLKVIGYAKISQGGVAGTVVDPSIIAKCAVDCLAKHVILGHNHPSGSSRASEADIKLTRQIKEGLKLLSVKVVEHVILTEDSYYSFSDEGMI